MTPEEAKAENLRRIRIAAYNDHMSMAIFAPLIHELRTLPIDEVVSLEKP